MRIFNNFFLGACALAQVAAATIEDSESNAALLSNSSHRKPNFIFIITDDQDLHMDSLKYQSNVQKYFVQQGTTFDKHYCTVALCCPSRVSLLTGRAAHNTNVTNIIPPYGGYPKFIQEGWNDNYLPVWLQDAGYKTYYAGKLMNGLSTSTYNSPYPKGWTSREFYLDPNTYIYFNATMQRDQDSPIQYTGNYTTDLLTTKTLGYLDDAISGNEPFFLGVAPIAPHGETNNDGGFDPPLASHRHRDSFPGLQAPRTSNFNPDVPSGGGWIKTLERLNQTVVDYLDEWYRGRILALQSVDEMVGKIVDRLERDPRVLENTYLIYTSDNGYHIGQHRLAPGKTCPIEEDINVPFVIRGPGIAKGANVSLPTSHTDIVPTLFELAGIPLQSDFDGRPMPVISGQKNKTSFVTEHVNVEYWGDAINEGQYPGNGSCVIHGGGLNNTYKSLRVIGHDYNLAYVVWCTNEHELYDMKTDQGQMNNLYNTNGTVNGWNIDKLTARIDALLLTLKACKGQVCTRPWETLHPQDNVHCLKDAMDPQYDDFYLEQQLKVTFTACKRGYLADFEGALYPISYTGNASLADGGIMSVDKESL